MRPINVLHLRDTYEIGGPGKTILETYRAIDASRFRLSLGVFVTGEETAETPFVAAARASGMPVRFIRGRNQYDPRMIRQVADLARSLDVDILHAHEVKSDVIAFLASKLHPVAIMTTVHGWIGNSAKQRFMGAVDRRVIRKFDRVVAVSGQIREHLASAGVPDERLSLLHNAIVVERYRRTGARGFLAQLGGEPLAGPVLASIGRISPEKGQADLVEALGILKAQGRAVSAVLAGDGPDRASITARIRALGLEASVRLPGYVDPPQRILEETDLMVLPSHTEGLPNVVLEALAMEVPVLATRVGGTPEIVTDGETGRLVEPRSPAALAAAIGDFLANPAPWREMARRGRERVETRFDFQARTRRLEDLYSALAARGAS